MLATPEAFSRLSDSSSIFPKWLNHFSSSLTTRFLDSSIPQSFSGIRSDWTSIIPLLSEQSRIAAVLDTVDEAIAKTEAVIAKLKQVRAGLLHDLLTRGLDEHGQLRDPVAHPEQFQDSPLGWIPAEWNV